MIITISGDPGAGKSVVAKKLAGKLGYKRYYMGKMHREIARKKGISLNEHLKKCRTDPKADMEIDEFQKSLAKKDNIIVEGRTSFHFIPSSIKIFFRVEPKVGAMRIIKDSEKSPDERNEEIEPEASREVKKIRQRETDDRKRYRRLYGIDILDMSNYDIIIDSTSLTPEEQAEETLRQIKRFRTQGSS